MKYFAEGNIKQHVLQVIAMLVISVLLTSSALFLFPNRVNATTGDEVRAAKKIVSVVYDDSGSMRGARWPYASYATQSLIALLNEQDELYITFMKEPYDSKQISLSSLQDSVNMIHDMSESGETPEESLDTAMTRLDNIDESDPTTQFWYIVMTDGEIFDTYHNVIDIQGKLDSYKNRVMSNSTELNVVYLGMCGAAPVAGDPANHLYSYMPDDDSAIVSAMQDISNLVSSRIVVDNINRVNSNTIKISSDLPLYNISILSQRSSASVKSAKTQEFPLNVQRNISLDATDLAAGDPMPMLYGNAAVLNYEKDGQQMVIPAGEYTIEFSNEVDVSDITIQTEPAISFRTEVTRNGVVLDDVIDLNYADKVSIKIIPIIPGTDEVIPEDTLPDGTTLNIEYKVDGNDVATSQDDELTDITIQEGKNTIRGNILIPGFVPFIKEQSFNIFNVVYHFGILVDQPKDLSYDRSLFKERFWDKNEIISFNENNTVKFTITNDGIPLSVSDQETIGVSLKLIDLEYIEPADKGLLNMFESKLMGCRLEQNADGSYSLMPEIPDLFFSTLKVKSGEYIAHVKVSKDDKVTATGSFVVRSDFWEFSYFVAGLIVLLIIAYLIRIITKKKFKTCTVCYEEWRINRDDGSGILSRASCDERRLSVFTGLLWPNSASRTMFKRLKLVADADRDINVTGRSIEACAQKYGNAMGNPEYNLASMVEGLSNTVLENGKREAETMLLSSDPLYLYDGNMVWRIWVEE